MALAMENPIIAALERDDLEAVYALLERGESVNCKNYFGWTPLHFAVSKDNEELLQAAVRHGAKLDALDALGQTALYIAAKNNNNRMAFLLLKSGAKVNVKDEHNPVRCPIYAAAYNGNLFAVKMMVAAGGIIDPFYNDNQILTAMRWELYDDPQYRMLYDLVKEECREKDAKDPYVSLSDTVLHAATISQNIELVRYVITTCPIIHSTKYLKGFLHNIHAKGYDKELIKLLIKDNATEFNRKYFFHCCALGDVEMAVYLLQRGADIHYYIDETVTTNVKNKKPIGDVKEESDDSDDEEDEFIRKGHTLKTMRYNETALHRATRHNKLSMVKFLVQLGAKIDAQDINNDTALHMACRLEHFQLAKFLVQCGADVNARNHYDETPLHLAAYNGHLRSIRLLLQYKADINARDHNGEKPLQIAERAIRPAAISLLLRHSADSAEN